MDEKPFEVGSIPNRQNTRIYKRKSQKNTIKPIQKEKFSTKIHTFCCINWNGKSDVRVYIKYVPKRNGCGFEKNIYTWIVIQLFNVFMII